MADNLRVGTSGWHYDHWRGPFYPRGIRSGQMLEFYSHRLSTVEINNSFYHLPSQDTFRLWSQETPQRFMFAVKASRYITHMKKLKDPEPALDKFSAQASGLGSKLAVVLFQLPPHWRRDAGRLRDFLQVLPAQWRYAFEFRDPSWFHPEIWALLEQHHVALCVFDLAGQHSPLQLTTDFAYLRLHGASEKYGGRYSGNQLQDWLRICRGWLKTGAREAFVYFNNDQSGYAALNALELQAMSGLGR